MLSALAAGLLVGGGLFAGWGSTIPRRVWIIVGASVVAGGFIIIGILGPVWSVFLGAAIVGLGGGCMNAVVGLAFVENVADAQRGAVLSAQNAIATLIPAAGIGATSLLIEIGSLHLATTALVLLWIVAAALTVLSPSIRRLGRVTH